MKLSKKILTFVAPIAATMTIAPIITSCNNETFVFKYGDSINCLRQFKKGEEFQDVALHSLNKVKQVSISNAPVWPDDTITQTELNMFTKETATKWFYYDLVASLANNGNVGFAFQWNDDGEATPVVQSLKYLTSEQEVSISDITLVSYVKGPEIGTLKDKICIQVNGTIGGKADTLYIESYTFKNTTIVA